MVATRSPSPTPSAASLRAQRRRRARRARRRSASRRARRRPRARAVPRRRVGPVAHRAKRTCVVASSHLGGAQCRNAAVQWALGDARPPRSNLRGRWRRPTRPVPAQLGGRAGEALDRLRRRLAGGRRVRGHPLRDRGRDREDHDRPARGAQRLPAADDGRALRRARARARGHRRRRDRADRRGPARVLLRRRPARARRLRLHGRRRAAKASVGRFHVTDLHVQMRRLPKPIVAMVAGYAIGGGHVLHVRLRPHDRRRQRPLRPDRPEGRQLRRRLRRQPAGRPGRPEEGEGDLVPLPPVRRPAGARHGPGQHRRPARASSRRRRSSGAARCSSCRRSRCGC